LILDLNTIIQTSIQITNRIYPYKKISPSISMNDVGQIKGSLNLIYIVRILLDNIIEHSKLESGDLEIDIEATKTDDDFLCLKFINNLATTIDTIQLNEVLEETKIKWRKSEQDYTKTDIEGGSGFDKIRRILTFDMRNKTHYFDFKITEHYISISIYVKLLIENE
jgi:hypothetical protein